MATSDTSSNKGSLSVTKEDKGGKNKRKLDDDPLQNPVRCSSSSSLTEFPPHESSLDKHKTPPQCKHLESGFSESDDWDDPLARQLEELLLSTIRTIYQNAIRLLIRRGYSEEIAFNAISRKGFYHRGTDIVENVVNDADSFLMTGKGNSREIVFENFLQMVKYTVVELVNVLKQVKPLLSAGEIMWWLLICDMNVSQVCEMEEDLLGGASSKEISGKSNFPKVISNFQSSELSQNIRKPNTASSSPPCDDSCMDETLKFGSFLNSPKFKSPVAPEKETVLSAPGNSEKSSSVQTVSQSSSFEEKLKARSKLNKKELATLQKTLNAERALKNHAKLISQSGKITNVGSVPSRSIKGSALKMKAKVEARIIGGSCQAPSNNLYVAHTCDEYSSKMHIKEPNPIQVSAAETTETVVAEKKPTSKLEAVLPKISDYYAGIPYDKSLGKHVPQDEKDELILKLVPQVEALQDDVQGWTDWANQKVMQAARRLSKDKLEVKALKQEKEEGDQLEKEKKILEENAKKRQTEMELAFLKASNQVEVANSAIQTLEAKRSLLRKEMQIHKLEAIQTAKNCQVAFERETKVLKDVQSINKQKGLVEDELKAHKQKVVELQQEKCKAEKARSEVEGKWSREKALKEAMLAQFASIKCERQKSEAARKEEENIMRKGAEIDAKKYEEEIEKLAKEVAEIKLKSDASKIAALKRGMGGNYGGTDNLDAGLTHKMKGRQDSNAMKMEENSKGLKRERECVMCLSEEKSVVFLPCAHQILCINCNELHKKQGMKDCPTCRTPVHLRFPARFVHQ